MITRLVMRLNVPVHFVSCVLTFTMLSIIPCTYCIYVLLKYVSYG